MNFLVVDIVAKLASAQFTVIKILECTQHVCRSEGDVPFPGMPTLKFQVLYKMRQ